MKWARETVTELGLSTSAQLRKFVRWVNKMEEKVLEALGRLDHRPSSPGAKRALPEKRRAKHYFGSVMSKNLPPRGSSIDGSRGNFWQDLSPSSQ